MITSRQINSAIISPRIGLVHKIHDHSLPDSTDNIGKVIAVRKKATLIFAFTLRNFK